MPKIIESPRSTWSVKAADLLPALDRQDFASDDKFLAAHAEAVAAIDEDPELAYARVSALMFTYERPGGGPGGKPLPANVLVSYVYAGTTHGPMPVISTEAIDQAALRLVEAVLSLRPGDADPFMLEAHSGGAQMVTATCHTVLDTFDGDVRRTGGLITDEIRKAVDDLAKILLAEGGERALGF